MVCCGTGLWWYISIFISIMFILTRISAAFKYYVKYVGFLLYCILLAGCCGIFCLFHKPGSSQNLNVAKFFVRFIRFEWMFGLDIQIENKEKLHNAGNPCVVVSNHQTAIDPLIVVKSARNGTAPLAKKILLYVPIFGQVSWLCGTVFINRKKGKSAVDIMKKVGREMKEKMTSLWVFPEGTRYQYDTVMPFKKGAFHLAIQAQVPIVPVVIGNYRNVMDCENLKFEGGPIRVKCLDSISTVGLTSDDVDTLIEKTRNIMLEVFEEDFQQHKHLYEGEVFPPKKSE